MPISKTGCLFIHVPKCAGTSFEVALEVASEYPNIGLEPTKTRPNEDLLFGGGLQHLSIREVNNVYPQVKTKATFSFAIIREPIERFASYLAWRYHRFQADAPTSRQVAESIERGFFELNRVTTNLSIFANPLMGVLQLTNRQDITVINDPLRHLYPQCGYTFENAEIGVDRIYRFDRIRSAEQELTSFGHLSKPLSFRMKNDYTASILSALNQEQKKLIKDVYHHDCRLFETI